MTNAFLASGLFGQLLCDEPIAREFGAYAFERRMCDFELAWTRALRDLGAVDARAADRALAAIGSCRSIDYALASARDGVPVPTFVAALRHGLDEAAAKAIHTGATSQDVLDTAMVLTLLTVLDDLGARLSEVVGCLADLKMRHGEAPLMARTRMQAARAANVAHRVDAWRRPLVHHAKDVAALRLDLGRVQVGGAVGLRDAPPGQGAAMAALVASTLGLAVGPVWHSDRTPIVAFGHWLAVLCGSLGKMGQDICLMAQQGVDEVTLRGGGQSSAMADKNNPVAAEAMVAIARFAAGQQAVLLQAMIHEQERSGAAWALEWLTLPSMAEATGASLCHAGRCLKSIGSIGSS